MKFPVELTINGREISAEIEPRLHLADFLREHLHLTATHLRCEQGACGACTLLIDGQPARSCITFAALCNGAEITTLEGLENDPVIAALRSTFSTEHGLQCGYCTPGMLVTARDIILRLPNADNRRIREEISGNLCRCTGYAGIVRAIARALDENRKSLPTEAIHKRRSLGPVGARPAAAGKSGFAQESTSKRPEQPAAANIETTAPGLAGRRPNIELRQAFTVAQSPVAVWAFFSDVARVVPCLPGASLTQPPSGDQIEGKISVKLGPITTNFVGHARVTRDDANLRGTIMGSGNDLVGGSRAAGEIEYVLAPTETGATRISLTIRALLAGPLAQFGRSGIVEDVVARITQAFAKNVEWYLSGSVMGEPTVSLQAGALLRQVLFARVKALFARLFGSSS
jgi:aerobic carbon-monoxide dehydrogenase small subunit